ncbi:Na+/H+ antiporter [Mucilaginibacter lutimaris]|uniref:Na+/H+ antiporter n=1 Tax=Mucilaginibacter lutimaris TaxID=931629 RepID=A0ABW2ZEQ9_9SPHI
MHYLIIQLTCLLAIILLVVMIAEKLKIAYPILLLLVGLPLGFVPALQGIEINPDVIFVIFLPPLLYEAAWNTSWKDFWKWRRIISSFAFPIVILTSTIVAWVSQAIIPGFTWSLGFLLGGIISPPDAVSATAILKNIKVPKNFVSIIEGESLLNDASSLVVFRFALAAVATGSFVFSHAAVDFVLVIIMGIVIGLAVAIVFYAIHRWMPTTTNIDIVLTFITPYAMYMIAEEFHYSGVLAVVSGGLFLSVRRQEFLTNQSRLQSINVWQAVAFVLNGFVFILIGLEFPIIIKGLGPVGLKPAINYSLIIIGVLIVTRFASAFGATLFTMFIGRYIKVAERYPGWKAPLLFGWTGMRGVVSLAAALSIPLTLSSGAGFPNRNLILFITFSVIIVTLVLQGLSLPFLVKWVNIGDREGDIPLVKQRQLIRKKLSHLSLTILNDKYAEKLESNSMLKSAVLRFTSDVELLKDWETEGNNSKAEAFYQEYQAIMSDLIKQQRALLSTLNKKENISEDLIKHQQELLDLEEEKIRQYFA